MRHRMTVLLGNRAYINLVNIFADNLFSNRSVSAELMMARCRLIPSIGGPDATSVSQ